MIAHRAPGRWREAALLARPSLTPFGPLTLGSYLSLALARARYVYVLGVKDLVNALVHASVHGCVGCRKLARELGVLLLDHGRLLLESLLVFFFSVSAAHDTHSLEELAPSSVMAATDENMPFVENDIAHMR